MGKKRIDREKIVNAFLFCAFDKSAGATSLQDISDFLQIKKASLYNHFSSKDEMYDATLVYCSDYLNSVNFLPDDLMKNDRIFNETVFNGFKKIIKRYVQLYETEPLFQIYTFVHTEQYYNKTAGEIADAEISKVEEGICRLLRGYAYNEKTAKIPLEELKTYSKWFSAALLQQLDSYIMHKKEIVRQNPESGSGSLFALPTDNKALNSIYETVEYYLGLLTSK